MNGGWYAENLEYDLVLMLWIKDKFGLEFIKVSKFNRWICFVRRREKGKNLPVNILPYVVLYEFILEKDS